MPDRKKRHELVCAVIDVSDLPLSAAKKLKAEYGLSEIEMLDGGMKLIGYIGYRTFESLEAQYPGKVVEEKQATGGNSYVRYAHRVVRRKKM